MFFNNLYNCYRSLLIFCVIFYFITMFILTLYVNYVENGIFVRAIQRDPLGYDPDVYWEVSSNLKKYVDTHLDIVFD